MGKHPRPKPQNLRAQMREGTPALEQMPRARARARALARAPCAPHARTRHARKHERPKGRLPNFTRRRAQEQRRTQPSTHTHMERKGQRPTNVHLLSKNHTGRRRSRMAIYDCGNRTTPRASMHDCAQTCGLKSVHSCAPNGRRTRKCRKGRDWWSLPRSCGRACLNGPDGIEASGLVGLVPGVGARGEQNGRRPACHHHQPNSSPCTLR